MAKIFEMHSFRRRNASCKYATDSSHFSQQHTESFRSINVPDRVSGGSWPASSLLTLLSTAVKLLPLIAVLWGLYLTGIGRKSGEVNPKQDEPVKALGTSQPARSGPPVSKPSPITPGASARVEGSIVPKQAPYAVAYSSASSVPRDPAIRYEATRKKVFGGCTGQLELTGSRLQFRCPNQADLIFPVAAIAKANKDGVILKSGEKYHFLIANRTKGQAEAIFFSWLNRVHQIPQPTAYVVLASRATK